MIAIPELKKDIEAEQNLIGCVMHAGLQSDDDCLDLVFSGIATGDFFDRQYREAFAAAKFLRDANESIDPSLVARRCRFDNAAGFIMEAMGSVTGAALAGTYVELVVKASRHRSVVTTSLDALSMAKQGGSAEAAIEVLKTGLESLAQTERTASLVTASQAVESYVRFLSGSNRSIPRSALRELDAALGGGVDFGEMIIVAARPSHGKTAIALQTAHNWTEDGLPVLYVSLEMSSNALGKRIMQYSSAVPEEHWRTGIIDVCQDLKRYHEGRAPMLISDSLKTLESIVSEIERGVRKHGIRAVVIDYAQLIQSPGKTRYEQITHTSTVLRGLASEHNILMLVLCQMGRDIESRKKFVPVMSDIKESGQFEQDADVVVFVVWPHRIDSSKPAHEYQFFVAKNRNRPIMTTAFTARFEPSRQRVVSPRVQDMPNYEPCFADSDPDYLP